MKEIQKCQKCGQVFATIDRTGAWQGNMSELMRHADEKECPKCGGKVIWVDEQNLPMNAAKRYGTSEYSWAVIFFWGGIIGVIIYFICRYFAK